MSGSAGMRIGASLLSDGGDGGRLGGRRSLYMSFLRGLRAAGRSGFTETEGSDSGGSLAAEGEVGGGGLLGTGFVGGRWLLVLTGGDDGQNSGDAGRVWFAEGRFARGMRGGWMGLFRGFEGVSSAESISIMSGCWCSCRGTVGMAGFGVGAGIGLLSDGVGLALGSDGECGGFVVSGSRFNFCLLTLRPSSDRIGLLAWCRSSKGDTLGNMARPYRPRGVPRSALRDFGRS